jgi:guanine deaminase
MHLFRARLCQSPVRGRIDWLDDAVIAVSGGDVAWVAGPDDPRHAEALAGPVEDLRGHGVLLPGFVDLHVHAPQFPQLGQALDVPLEDWLQTHTFPLEARYGDPAFAETVYAALVRTLLANGTTTAVYFATIHLQSSLRLAEICLGLGQRAVVGRVAMDHPEGCPDYYRDADAAAAVDLTAEFLARVPALPGNGGQVLGAVTPRFIPACSDAALDGLGQLTAATGAHVQTHCSESDWEHGHVRARCGVSDTAALNGFGLLTRRTVLAHANFIGDADMDLIRGTGAGVAHCPLSNVYFAGAVFPLRQALEKSLHVGLGSDISGGPSASLFDGCRSAISGARLLEDGVDGTRAAGLRGVPGARIDFRDAFWLATTGGAEVLDLPVGYLAPGRAFDAMLVNLPGDLVVGSEALTGEALLQKIVMLAQTRDVRATWVGGRRVHGGMGWAG